MKKIIKSIFMLLLVTILLTGCSKGEKLNTPVAIDSEEIIITVLSSETGTINKELSHANGEYIKVKVSIENKGTEEYSWNNFWNFKLGKEVAAITMEDDELPNEIAAGTEQTGYIYFKTTSAKILTYYTSPKATSNTDSEVITYTFNIK